MRFKRSVWLPAILIAALSLSIWGVLAYRSRRFTPAALLRRMPAQDALVVYIDFDKLRRAGILQLLAGSHVAEDPEYQAFVSKTGFDYRRDLDAALVAFTPTGKYLLLQGRFDWKALRSYVEAEEGNCANMPCRLTGSAPDRRISFFPLQTNLMAMAVSPDATAALRLQSVADGPEPEASSAPVWLTIPASTLKSRDDLPSGTRMFARGLESAELVTLSLAPEGGRLAARLTVRCRDARDASETANRLALTTNLLRQAIERERQKANPADLSGVLTAGSFRSEGRNVFGYWPIERAFVENMLGGS